MARSPLIAVQVRPGVVLRMTPEEAARYGFEPAHNKAIKPKAVKKAGKKTTKTREVADEPGDDS